MKRHIGSFSGLKLLLTLSVPYFHSGIPGALERHYPPVSWIMPFFFIVSGFCISARHWDEWADGRLEFGSALTFLKKKICLFWPLHLVGLAIYLLWIAEGREAGFETLLKAAVNAFGLSPWCTDHAFDFNSASWFIADLVFCYLAAPLLLTLFARCRRGVWLLAGVFAMRYVLEWTMTAYPKQFWTVDLHTFPVVRLLDFAFGLLLYPLFARYETRIGRDCRVWTTAEALALGLLIGIVGLNPYGLSRAVQSLLVGIAVLVFAVDAGLFSRVLGAPVLKRLAPYELLVFMLHLPVRGVVQPFISGYSPWTAFALWMLAVLVMSWAWLQMTDARVSRGLRFAGATVWGVSALFLFYRLADAYRADLVALVKSVL